jgi:pimeloyl-ACP methyl ester carboxylesterase
MNNRFFKFLLRKEGAFLLVIAMVSLVIYHDFSQPKSYSSLADYYSQSAIWDKCYDSFECMVYNVPIDYSDLTVGSFQISALRYPAQDGKHRIGSLIVNPGGPGASGVEYAYNAEYIFSPDLLDRYDIVGFDPRGVSRSAPIICYNDAETDANYASDSKPDNAAEFNQAVKDSKDFINKCLKKNEHLTAFSTANAARDMDILRALVGDKKLNYMGKSYGTYMGTLYAQLFPNNIGRVVLDGAVDPNISTFEQTKTQAVSFDNAFHAFIADCIKRSNCPLPRNEAQATDVVVKLWQAAATNPLPLRNKKDNRVATESLLVVGTASALYDSGEGWPQLRKAIGEALKGYGDTYLELADLYTGRQKDGTYPNNEFDSGAIIDCLDFADTRTPQQIRDDAKKVTAAAPIFGPYIGMSGLTCKYFPATKQTTVSTTKTNAPIVIVGTTGDPATPYAWAQGLSKLLVNSRLLTFVGDGHTGQGRGNGCIDDAIDAYYLKGTLPAVGLRCTA